MLYAGDDWAEDHHDGALVDADGRRLALARLPEGVAGIARFHELIAAHLPEGDEAGVVVVGIETDRGPWVTALVASVIRCMRSTRCRCPGTGSGIRPPGRK